MREFQDWVDEYNEMYVLSIAQHKQRQLKWLTETCTKAKNAYYHGNPIMDDKTYDHFEETIRINDPNHPFLEKVGTIKEKKCPKKK